MRLPARRNAEEMFSEVIAVSRGERGDSLGVVVPE
jgi:hypothetical protein